MTKEKHIFFVWSDFHYIVCKGIIEAYGINPEDCTFVVDRATKVEDGLNQSPIYGIGHYLLFGERVKYFLKNRKHVKAFFRNAKVTVYYPFPFRYPSHTYNDYVLYEEGLSSYKKVEYNDTNHNAFLLMLRKLFVFMISPFSKQIRGYLIGFICQERKPLKKIKLLSFSEDCYQHVQEPLVEKGVISVPRITVEGNDIPENSVVFVLDRISEFGRPFALDNYRDCVVQEIKKLKTEGVKKVYLKYHPQDYNYEGSKGWMENILNEYQMEYAQFNGRLEYLAIQNIGIKFIGTNSTILFYAPILGKTNKSESFYKRLAVRDEQYRVFIEGWDDFEHFFSKNVKCV